MNDVERINNLRLRCWKDAYFAYGTGWIFQEKAKRLSNYLSILNYVGLFVPLIVGAVVTAFGTDSPYLGVILLLVGLLGIIQTAGFGWSLIRKWSDKLSYAIEAMNDNYRQAEDYETLARDPPSDLEIFKSKFELLTVKYQHRDDLDNRQNITQEERRMGYRASLWKYGKECPECKKVPRGMDASNCEVCGKFKLNHFLDWIKE